jgi:hypothetical protein
MKLEYQNRWMRLLIELFPTLLEIRRYRMPSARFEAQTKRLLRRHIRTHMHRSTCEERP